MARRLIVKIDPERCDGCGLCVPACAEGALQIVDGVARLVKDSYCDGLGACLGDCPRDAITLEEREAEDFDAEAVEEHLQSMRGCPVTVCPGVQERGEVQWPVQLRLISPHAPFLAGREILVAADCVPAVCHGYHREVRGERPVLLGCPKLDDPDDMVSRLAAVIRQAGPRGLTVAYLEVPCCHALDRLVREAVRQAGRAVPVRAVMVGTGGEIRS